LRKIQLDIAAEEYLCTEDGVAIERDHTPGSFITMGLALEEVQYVVYSGFEIHRLMSIGGN
jgi:hypothetical protein